MNNTMKDIKKILRPDETYNQAVDADIEREGCLDWMERVLTEQLVDQLVQKEWYAETAYMLHRLDEICRQEDLPLLMDSDPQRLRAYRLFDKE